MEGKDFWDVGGGLFICLVGGSGVRLGVLGRGGAGGRTVGGSVWLLVVGSGASDGS